MASVTPQVTKLKTEDSAGRQEMAKSAVEAKVESVVGINIAALEQDLINEGLEDDRPIPEMSTNRGQSMVELQSGGSPQRIQGQGQHFEPLDKAASQTVKLNPKMELSRPDLLKLLSYMEAELQARDVVIATLKTERIKNLLHYGRVGINDPFLALQRDNVGAKVFGNVSEGELRSIEETQLQQLENLIGQQRKAHQRMRQILREAEKRHSWTVEELHKERRKQELDSQNDEVGENYDRSDNDTERVSKRKMERELKKMQESLEEEKGKQKQIILMLVEERKRLALQYVEERKRSEDLAQILSEEKGRIDSMAEGLEEESKKSLQMEAELEKQLAEFDTERQQMRAQLAKKEERILELETIAEKLQREVEHCKKQLQEAHNVAMFQQTLSVSPPRLGMGTSQRAQPPQLPAKPTTLTQGQPRLQATPSHSNVSKAVQLTATVNSVPVTGPTTGIARGIQSGTVTRTTLYNTSSEVSRPITTSAKTYSESENAWVGGPVIDCETSTATQSDRSLSRLSSADSSRGQSQVVQVSPRVNVSASSGTKVITTSHGGKVTFHVTTNASGSASPVSSGTVGPPNGQTSGTSGHSLTKKPLPPSRSSQPPPIPLNKPIGAPPVPPNKPIVPPKKDLISGRTAVVDSPPISVEVKPQKVGPQTVKFGITISKTSGGSSSFQSSASSGGGSITPNLPSDSSSGVENAISAARRETTQVDGDRSPRVHACVDSLSPELENFQQLLNSMADPSDVVAIPSPQVTLPHATPSSTNCGDSHTINSSLANSQQGCINNYVSSFIMDKSSILSSFTNTSSSSYEESYPPFPLTLGAECEESASSEAAKSAPMMDPSPQNDSSPSNLYSVSAPLYSTTSSSFNKHPLSLPVNSSIETITTPPQEDHMEPPHSPLDVATPLTADGMTALHLAAQGNNWQSVAMLIKCGAGLTTEDDEGRTPLYLALLYSCVAAAKALLQYPQSMEHTTKSGCNLLHAATKSGEVECVSILVGHILNNWEDGLGFVHLLATSPEHHGHTPLALAVAATSTDMVEVLVDCGLNVRALAAHNSLLLQVSSPAASALLSYQDMEEQQCCVWLRGAPLSSELDNVSKWAVGVISVDPSTEWNVLENRIITMLMEHWNSLASYENGFKSEWKSSVDSEIHSTHEVEDNESVLGLTESAIECFCIGNHYWKKGNSNTSHLPYMMLQDTSGGNSSKDIVVHLHPLAAVSYSCLIPVFLLENYLRLMDQSKCVVVYGAKDSGKRTLVRSLAALWCESFSEDSYSKVDLHESSNEELLISSVEESLRIGCILVLERVPRDLWPTLWASLKRGATKRGGRILATMDSWRRPSGQLESEVLWVQLRHDREPLSGFLYRYLIRQISSMSAGVIPSQATLCRQVINWINSSYSRLSDTFMSLGFSTVLRGPQLFIKELRGASNPKDILLGVQEVWNSILVPAICHEVHNVWRGSPLYGGDRAPDESRVSAMAIHVIFQRAFSAGVNQLPPTLLKGFHCRGKSLPPRPQPPPRPKDLPISNGPSSIDHQHPLKKSPDSPSSSSCPDHKPKNSPTSPEWNQDTLAKILGLSPMGYA